jgi:hypothetical protein
MGCIVLSCCERTRKHPVYYILCSSVPCQQYQCRHLHRRHMLPVVNPGEHQLTPRSCWRRRQCSPAPACVVDIHIQIVIYQCNNRLSHASHLSVCLSVCRMTTSWLLRDATYGSVLPCVSLWGVGRPTDLHRALQLEAWASGSRWEKRSNLVKCVSSAKPIGYSCPIENAEYDTWTLISGQT